MQKQISQHAIPRRESLLKATGQAQYVDDMAVPNLAYGGVLRSPYARARVTGLDLTEARQVPGVLGILTPQDLPDTLFNCAGSPPSPLLVDDERVLTSEPLYAGDRIAAVAAKTREACQEALSRIKVAFEPLDPIFGIKQAIAPGAGLIQDHTGPGNIARTITADQGDVEQGLAQAELVLSEQYYAPAVQHAALEPTACICHYEPTGNLTVWANTQAPFQDRRILAKLTGLPESRIRVIKPAMGGGFGARQQMHNQHVGAFLSKLVKRPVKIINTREEEMYASVTRHEALVKVRAGVSRSGYLQAFDIEAFFNTGPYLSHSPVVAAAAARKFQYRVPHYRYQGHCVMTNSPPAGAMRGYGNPQVSFARESMLDRLAAEVGMDPLEFRLMNHIQVGDKLTASPLDIYSCAIEQCARESARIKDEIELAQAPPKEGLMRAWGVAFACHCSGPSNKDGMSGCVILANDDGSVQLLTGSADIGQGSETALSQLAARVLGIGLDDVAIIAADTAHTPYETGTFASSQMYVAGNAVKRASDNLIKRLRQALSDKYDVPLEQIIWQDGGVTFPDGSGETTLDFKQAVKEATFHSKGAVLAGRASFKAEESPPPFAVCWAQVELDPALKSVRVLDVIQAVDVGTPINPQIVKGQVEGGISMGLGYAMMESIENNPRADKPISSDFLHYRLPLAKDMPRIKVFIADNFEPTGPLGAKSVGELVTVPVAPAIANALTRARGRAVTKLPVCRELVPAFHQTTGGQVGPAEQEGRS
jgi:CO/xanthine dehydrogenase Mo-binding subunit